MPKAVSSNSWVTQVVWQWIPYWGVGHTEPVAWYNRSHWLAVQRYCCEVMPESGWCLAMYTAEHHDSWHRACTWPANEARCAGVTKALVKAAITADRTICSIQHSLQLVGCHFCHFFACHGSITVINEWHYEFWTSVAINSTSSEHWEHWSWRCRHVYQGWVWIKVLLPADGHGRGLPWSQDPVVVLGDNSFAVLHSSWVAADTVSTHRCRCKLLANKS